MAGMGRGAGNTNTELVMQFMNRRYNSGYDIDSVLDLIDNYIDGIRNRCEWGYSVPNFLAGSYSAHVNNIAYLSTKAGIASRDINYLLNRLSATDRKRYDYNLLEKIYMEYLGSFCDDTKDLASLQQLLDHKDVLILLPGHTLESHRDEILSTTRNITRLSSASIFCLPIIKLIMLISATKTVTSTGKAMHIFPSTKRSSHLM